MNVIELTYNYVLTAFTSLLSTFVTPSSFLSAGPLIVAFLIAFAIVYVRMALRAGSWFVNPVKMLRMLFPKRIFFHHSARMDYLVLLINNGFLFFLTLSLVLTPAFIAETIFWAGNEFGGISATGETTLLHRIAFTIVLVLAWDFGATYAHYLKHKVPLLWEFHKVHHSAEVLTPVTALRRHPVDMLVGSLVTTLSLGVATGLWFVTVGKGTEAITIFGAWAGIYIWRLLGYNLRHSHIWISYGDFWNRVFISPAQHQIHHSTEEMHYDKNFGHIFSFWDAMFGTLYLPRHEERVRFGIDENEMEDFRSLGGVYLSPIRKSLTYFNSNR